MALFSGRTKALGLTKESARGVAEASASKFRAVLEASELTYTRNLLADEGLRKLNAQFPSKGGRKRLTGAISGQLRASDIGEFIQMLMGDPTTVLDSTADAFKHTFGSPLVSETLLPTYTLFMDRGVSAQKYNRSSVKSLNFTADQEGIVNWEAEVFAQTESSTSALTPAFAQETRMLNFKDAVVTIAGGASALIKNWNVKLDNALFPLETLGQSEDIQDLLAVGPFTAEFGFTVYLESEVERAKFIAATTSSLKFDITGDLIEDSSFELLSIVLPKTEYEAHPYGIEDGLFAAAVTGKAVYDTATSEIAKIELTNKETSY